ncbi:hypothetical protein PanWU01x14_371380 [Parasponia andersonii]|uniref:Uncharacterized protein n=1 Tax=Parasponia andersonii TaxID=3476 RepID=A0A2P5A3W5_PARAD|nr:hypothetical protein PanWU01x14_371380 [Parasponia andersonii]
MGETTAAGEVPCSFMAAKGEIPMVIDVHSRRRKIIFQIVRSSIVGNQESAHTLDYSTGSR